MKNITVVYPVYTFDELDEKVQDKVINDEITCWIEMFQDEKDMSKGMKKAIRKAERMQTPWFTASYIWDYCKKEVLQGCGEYDYFVDGEIFIIEDHNGVEQK
jgi:hypothetical protein